MGLQQSGLRLGSGAAAISEVIIFGLSHIVFRQEFSGP
jgi:hypothetical protein